MNRISPIINNQHGQYILKHKNYKEKTKQNLGDIDNNFERKNWD